MGEMLTETYDMATGLPKKKTKKSKTKSETKPVDKSTIGPDDLHPEPNGVCFELHAITRLPHII